VTSTGNVAEALRRHAKRDPDHIALITPAKNGQWDKLTYGELNTLVDGYAYGFQDLGLKRGDRVLFLVKPGQDFYAALFGLFRLGAVPVLIDPGMGLKNVLNCIRQIKPSALLAIPVVQLIRLIKPAAFRSVKTVITAGSRWFWGGVTLKSCLNPDDGPFVSSEPFTGEEEGFIAFTSGSTGPPKGVSFLHRMFVDQARLLGMEYGLGPTEVAVECFAAFVIYDLSLGMTTVLPDMNLSKPATAKPENIVEAIVTHGATTAFASPVVWANLVRHSRRHSVRLPTLKRLLTAGAPISADMHRGVQNWVSPGVQLFTPYGATECLPVASIGSDEVLGETAAGTAKGDGVCVGRPFEGITIRLIAITDEEIATWAEVTEVGPGQIGEIVIDGPVVSPEYKDNESANALSKIRHEGRVLHRIGDLGTFDTTGRLWFCGRKTHALWTEAGMIPAVPVEGVANTVDGVCRTALVGTGPRGRQVGVLCVDLEPGVVWGRALEQELLARLGKTRWDGVVTRCLVHPGFPVDPRHNSKIKREQLAMWAADQ